MVHTLPGITGISHKCKVILLTCNDKGLETLNDATY